MTDDGDDDVVKIGKFFDVVLPKRQSVWRVIGLGWRRRRADVDSPAGGV